MLVARAHLAGPAVFGSPRRERRARACASFRWSVGCLRCEVVRHINILRALALHSGHKCCPNVVVTNLRDKQRIRLESTTAWAKKIRDTLGPILSEHGERVHFRPASTGFAMIGLLPDRPQRGKGGLQDLQHVCQNFDVFFAAQCCDIEQGRVTGEKALQSWLIRDAQTHNGRLHAINVAAQATNEPIELVFVTDEIAVPMETGEIVCDLLALRVDGGRSTPVLLELKDRRKFK
jgi:hypothetical protein